MQVLHADGTSNAGENHGTWLVTADADGHFETTWTVCGDDCLGSTLQATATGQSSGLTAQTTFTDKKAAAKKPAKKAPAKKAK